MIGLEFQDALMTIYRLVWDEFCSWYLEMMKPAYGQGIDKASYDQVIHYFESLLKILHPFMPFISEEIYQQLSEENHDKFLMNQMWPDQKEPSNLAGQFEQQKELIAEIRNIRKNKGISFKESLSLNVISKQGGKSDQFDEIIKKLVNLDNINYVTKKQENCLSFVIGLNEYFIPFEDQIDKESEMERLKEELAYQEGFLNSVNKKLSNDRFVRNAPEKVVELEQKKKNDAESKILLLKKQLETLN